MHEPMGEEVSEVIPIQTTTDRYDLPDYEFPSWKPHLSVG